MSVSVGQPVPDFSVAATGDQTVQLSNLAGRWAVLYFYPRDNTPGCTLEGQQFRDLHQDFIRAGVMVFGVSRDSVASHERFKAKMNFPFDLLSDSDETMCRLFDVIREKNMYGRKVMGIERSTFLIGRDGGIEREWRGVKVDGHAQAVLDAAKSMA